MKKMNDQRPPWVPDDPSEKPYAFQPVQIGEGACIKVMSSKYIEGQGEFQPLSVNWHCGKTATRHCSECGFRCDEHPCGHLMVRL